MPKPQILVLKDANAVAHAGAERVRQAGHLAVSLRGSFHWVLAGGNTPRALYELLVSEEAVNWRATHVYFGDERHVLPTDPDSNYGMAERALFRHGLLAPDRILRMRGELPSREGAMDYEERLRAAFPDAAWPTFDLVLLGLGADGHTASLFPHTAALDSGPRWVMHNQVPSLGTERLTLTFPALNAAREIVFLVAGADKARALHALVEGHQPVAEIPARGVQPASGQCLILADEAAAAGLRR
ncbi:MAG TPA: 6-phosphogluconolactonase [Polyangiaceae bacterium]|nr:6-phosphogluconolactonase [Polyangiaceae bacterium]